MKVNKNVLKLIAREANKDAIYNLLVAIIQHVEGNYDYTGIKTNNILGIILGDKLVEPTDVNLDKIIEHSDWLYKRDDYNINSTTVESIDNINCTVKIKYNYTTGSNKEEYENYFDISYVDYPDILVNDNY